jgi:hypothetical protein
MSKTTPTLPSNAPLPEFESMICDQCGDSKGTLYDTGVKLVCLRCTGIEDSDRFKDKIKLTKMAVTGKENLQRRRNAMNRRNN